MNQYVEIKCSSDFSSLFKTFPMIYHMTGFGLHLSRTNFHKIKSSL
jgi:hypothetical protein